MANESDRRPREAVPPHWVHRSIRLNGILSLTLGGLMSFLYIGLNSGSQQTSISLAVGIALAFGFVDLFFVAPRWHILSGERGDRSQRRKLWFAGILLLLVTAILIVFLLLLICAMAKVFLR